MFLNEAIFYDYKINQSYPSLYNFPHKYVEISLCESSINFEFPKRHINNHTKGNVTVTDSGICIQFLLEEQSGTHK